jgi:hypothetical protein
MASMSLEADDGSTSIEQLNTLFRPDSTSVQISNSLNNLGYGTAGRISRVAISVVENETVGVGIIKNNPNAKKKKHRFVLRSGQRQRRLMIGVIDFSGRGEVKGQWVLEVYGSDNYCEAVELASRLGDEYSKNILVKLVCGYNVRESLWKDPSTPL